MRYLLKEGRMEEKEKYVEIKNSGLLNLANYEIDTPIMNLNSFGNRLD